MKTLILCCSCMLIYFSNELNGQSIRDIAEKFTLKKSSSFQYLNGRGTQECEPDSILFFGFISPEDSIVGIRRVFRQYGNLSRSIYEYEFIDESGVLKLSNIDSTVFDQTGRPVLNEKWRFNADSNSMLLDQRTLYFPHEGPVIKDYSFVEHMLGELDFNGKVFEDFDSVIIYRRDFFSSVPEPFEKMIYNYSPNGLLVAMYEYNYFSFLMSWSPRSRRHLNYTTSNRIDKVEFSTWDGIGEYILTNTSLYAYDSSDSLRSIIVTNNISGLPQENLEMSYDAAQNISTARVFGWDEETSQWIEAFRIQGKFDEMTRIEALEIEFNFFGDSFASLYQYVYPGNETCPHYLNVYQSVDNSWVFGGRIYFYTVGATSVYEDQISNWKVYPNPANDGIWIEAPLGSHIQISTMQGNIIYNGQITSEREYLSLNQTNTQMILTIRNDESISSRLIMVNK